MVVKLLSGLQPLKTWLIESKFSHLAVLMRSQFLLLWASPKGLLIWRLLSFPRMSGSVKNLQSFFRCYTSSVLYLLSLTGQPCDRLRENYTVVEISGDMTHLGSS